MEKIKLCLRCNETQVPKSKVYKYCDNCRVIVDKEQRRISQLNFAKRNKEKKKVDLDNNFRELKLEGLDLLPENFDSLSEYKSKVYSMFYKKNWIETLEMYGSLESLTNSVVNAYRNYYNETGFSGFTKFASSLNTSLQMISLIGEEKLTQAIGVSNYITTSEESRKSNFFMIREKLGRLPYTMNEFNENSQINFETYCYHIDIEDTKILSVMKNFIDEQEYNIYVKEREHYFSENRRKEKTGKFMYTDEEVLLKCETAIEKHVKDFGDAPKLKDFTRETGYSGGYLKERLDMTYSELLETFGYSTNQWKKSTEKVVIDRISNILRDSPKRQATFEWLRSDYNRKLRCDAYFEKYNFIFEYDGEFHFNSIKGLGGDEALQRVQKADKTKNELIPQHGIKLVRVAYFEPYWDEDFLRMRLIENGIKIPNYEVIEDSELSFCL